MNIQNPLSLSQNKDDEQTSRLFGILKSDLNGADISSFLSLCIFLCKLYVFVYSYPKLLINSLIFFNPSVPADV